LDLSDIGFQFAIGVTALTIMNYVLFDNSLLISAGASVAMMVSFLAGRIGVKLIRRRLARRMAND
jgi:hypothetical protein